jgi:hypothetical protein
MPNPMAMHAVMLLKLVILSVSTTPYETGTRIKPSFGELQSTQQVDAIDIDFALRILF